MNLPANISALIGLPTFEMTYLGNTVTAYVDALIVFAVFSVVFAFVQWAILARLQELAKKTKTNLDDLLINVVKSFKPQFYFFLSFYLAVLTLNTSTLVQTVVNAILIIWVVYQGVRAIHILIDYVLERHAKKTDGKDTEAAYGFVGGVVKWSIWIIAILLVLSNLGVNITSLVAGLGIGGIAVAFALQNILGDLFSSFAIYFDKPFQVGDLIVVGEYRGTVERIGLKTTRIRALQGEEIVISNQELTSSKIQNFRKLKERRATFSFGILYETPVKKIEKIPQIVKEIFEATDSANLDRVHFTSFGDSALNFDVVHYVQSSEYGEFLDVQESINLSLMKAFEKEKIEFAYPTQTLYVKK